ncbi:hypothetical protein SAMD00019534_013860 [Acytostelium subglobosum LB1]|uniref:hypothetical protein n=1 Tax=Acytostelium subglobosum LB1 TaxID=1410327 RepID=UPI00064499B9|nr:hypothetical protein SAMD00019534_013860 [Acytostelium subglobosum LB1]GAM18211.1 hypothetical protein SAMD00019534_013860 [Acytostelium subglobosum LB1]|eukprot:XP_012758807.1 hypothetical protein SAMD00019534_013860 [Acytostelium subglobosum LB1]
MIEGGLESGILFDGVEDGLTANIYYRTPDGIIPDNIQQQVNNQMSENTLEQIGHHINTLPPSNQIIDDPDNSTENLRLKIGLLKRKERLESTWDHEYFNGLNPVVSVNNPYLCQCPLCSVSTSTRPNNRNEQFPNVSWRQIPLTGPNGLNIIIHCVGVVDGLCIDLSHVPMT